MAYVNTEKKAKIKAQLDVIMKGTGIKWSLAVRNHSTIVMNIRSGLVDFISNYNNMNNSNKQYGETQNNATAYIQVNPYHFGRHFDGEAVKLLSKIFKALNTDNFDKSDIMTDYFCVGHYVECNIGKWDKPYIFQQ